MATFKVHEDLSGEHVQPVINRKKLCLKNKPVEPRGVLQPLSNYQQNAKRTKVVCGKENVQVVEPLPTEKGADLYANNVYNLRPVLKKTLQSGWIVSVDNPEKEYQDEIRNYLIKFEHQVQAIKPHYMTKQIHLNWEMRSVLIDWLVNVAEEYKMSSHTIHLGINYLDRFLSNISVIREKFQLVGVAAMTLAGKISEIYPPDVKEWSYLTRDTFTIRQITKMEQLMLRVLNFEMHPPTILDFIKMLCAKHKMDSRTMHLAMYFSELVLMEGENYLQYFPSKLAAASLVLARYTLYKSEIWSKKFEETAGYTLKQLSPVVKKQEETFKGSPLKKQQAIQKKYASSKYQRVALLKPRTLQLELEDDDSM